MSKRLEIQGKESIKPIGNRILLQLNPVESISKPITKNDGTKTELILPDLHHEESRIGIVLAKGSEVEFLDVGDKVLVSWAFGNPLHFPGMGILDDTIRIGTKSEVWALIKEE